MKDFVTALGLVLAIEGTLYALLPGALKRLMAQAQETPDQVLRLAGLAALATGVFVVWFVRG
ncbi:DUF2065 domain-containing protein [Breoghania sp.]|uniref:DUF2065 domain-containing protein n=1 Tax=Breoghania sp. TaxID=2065378 RepID=UPI00261140A9|nr:DUF2065 domain-containing protein [Breoghania sp.]MDJ0931191.1 DUF2065 domain-containing protein [Breoghania sp.]